MSDIVLDVFPGSVNFKEGDVLSFRDSSGIWYDGVVWELIPEGSRSVSVVIRFIDRVY